MKNRLKSINTQFKDKTLRSLQIERKNHIKFLHSKKEEFLKFNQLERFVFIDEAVFNLSFYIDDEVIDLIKSFGLLKYTPNVFINNINFFQDLDTHQKQTKYLFPYEIIWGYYKLYSSSVIKEKMALDFNMDISAIAGRVNRQINNLNFPSVLTEVIEEVKKITDFVKKEKPNYKIPIFDKNPLTSVAHIVKYAHKNEFYNLYMFLADFNKEAEFIDFHEPDFNCDFYDLLKILFRDKSILNETEETVSNYYSIRQFKNKRVQRLILS